MKQPESIGLNPGDKIWFLYWSPEGKKIATVSAPSAARAIRKAPKPYKKYLGEIYAVRFGA